jgi:hypothetical protein
MILIHSSSISFVTTHPPDTPSDKKDIYALRVPGGFYAKDTKNCQQPSRIAVYLIEKPSSKTFKAVSVSLADRTLEWRLGPGTEIPANLTTPDWDAMPGKTDERFLVRLSGKYDLFSATFRYRLGLLLSQGDLF